MLPYNASKICRVCLLEDNNMIVLGNDDNTNTFAPINLLKATVNLEFRQSQELPDKICTKCFSTVRNYYAFKQMCYNSEEILHSYGHPVVVDDKNTDSLSTLPVIDVDTNTEEIETVDTHNLPMIVDQYTESNIDDKVKVIANGSLGTVENNIINETEYIEPNLKALQNSQIDSWIEEAMSYDDNDCHIVETHAEIVEVDDSDNENDKLLANPISCTSTSNNSSAFSNSATVVRRTFDETNGQHSAEVELSDPHVTNSDINKDSENAVQTPIKAKVNKKKNKTKNVNLQQNKKSGKASKSPKNKKDPSEYMVMLRDHRICCKCKQWRPLGSFENKLYLVCPACKLLPANQVLTTKHGALWASCWCGEIFTGPGKMKKHRKNNCYMKAAFYSILFT